MAGVWRDYVRQQGAVVIERSRYVALTGDDAVNEATLWLAPGVDAAAVRDDVARAAGAGRVLTATPADLRKLSLAAFDRTFAVTYALEAAAVLIGVVGLSAALVAQTLARSREFGMLRHVGMTRGQLRTMLAVEGATLAGMGVGWGLVLGFAISLILVNVVNRQSFHWGMDAAHSMARARRARQRARGAGDADRPCQRAHGNQHRRRARRARRLVIDRARRRLLLLPLALTVARGARRCRLPRCAARRGAALSARRGRASVVSQRMVVRDRLAARRGRARARLSVDVLP